MLGPTEMPINSLSLRKMTQRLTSLCSFLLGKDDTIGPSSLSVTFFRFSCSPVVTFLTTYPRKKKNQLHITYTPMLTASLGDGSIVKEGLPPSLTTTLDPWRKEKTEGILWFPQAHHGAPRPNRNKCDTFFNSSDVIVNSYNNQVSFSNKLINKRWSVCDMGRYSEYKGQCIHNCI